MNRPRPSRALLIWNLPDTSAKSLVEHVRCHPVQILRAGLLKRALPLKVYAAWAKVPNVRESTGEIASRLGGGGRHGFGYGRRGAGPGRHPAPSGPGHLSRQLRRLPRQSRYDQGAVQGLAAGHELSDHFLRHHQGQDAGPGRQPRRPAARTVAWLSDREQQTLAGDLEPGHALRGRGCRPQGPGHGHDLWIRRTQYEEPDGGPSRPHQGPARQARPGLGDRLSRRDHDPRPGRRGRQDAVPAGGGSRRHVRLRPDRPGEAVREVGLQHSHRDGAALQPQLWRPGRWAPGSGLLRHRRHRLCGRRQDRSGPVDQVSGQLFLFHGHRHAAGPEEPHHLRHQRIRDSAGRRQPREVLHQPRLYRLT